MKKYINFLGAGNLNKASWLLTFWLIIIGLTIEDKIFHFYIIRWRVRAFTVVMIILTVNHVRRFLKFRGRE